MRNLLLEHGNFLQIQALQAGHDSNRPLFTIANEGLHEESKSAS